MTARNVTHIVPFLLPTIDGVGDYALNLARHLREKHNWKSHFMVSDKDWSGPFEIENFTAERFVAAPSETTILHYVGYGYHPRGIPTNFVKTILSSPARIITIFHEIWSQGPPWRCVFYLSWLQKRLVQKILQASATAFVSTLNARRLLPQAHWLPIPANLPIIQRQSALPNSPRNFLIFGQMDTRLRAVQLHRRIFSSPSLASVTLAGKQSHPSSPDAQLLSHYLPKSKIRVVGEITNTQIFTEVDAFLSSHRAADACKSGALMAALASACPVILPDESDPAPLRFGHEILSYADLNRSYQNAGPTGLDWYYKNADWPIIAERIAEALS
jgi:hypothetical protein